MSKFDAIPTRDASVGPLTTARELASVVDHVPALIALFDLDLRNRFANWSHVPWFGVAPHEMYGRHSIDIVGQAVYDESLPYLDAVREGEPQAFERIMVTVGGERRYVVVNYEPFVVDGDIAGVLMLSTDVTGRVRTEFARRELARRVEAVGEREVTALEMQRSATERLEGIASALAGLSVADPAVSALVDGASDEMADAARRLRTMAAHRPGPGRPPGPEVLVRKRVEAATAPLGVAPTLVVLGGLDTLDDTDAALVDEVLGEMLDNTVQHAEADRVDVTVGLEHGDIVVVVADDGRGVVRVRPGSGLDRLRTCAQERGGRCTWVINGDDGTTVEWRAPVAGAALAPASPVRTDVLAQQPSPAGGSDRPPEGYRTTGTPALDATELRAVLDQLPMGIAVWSREFRNQYANRIAVDWFGLPDAADLLGRSVAEVSKPEDVARLMPLARAAIAGHHIVQERPVTDPAPGGPRHIRTEYLPRVVDGAVAGLHVHLTDIGERVRVESAMRNDAERAETLRARHASEEEVHHLAIQQVFAAALRLDTVRARSDAALPALDAALAPLDDAIADLRRSVVDAADITPPVLD